MTIEDAWGFSHDAKVGNVFEYAAGQWALAGEWGQIRCLLKSIACCSDDPMASAHRRVFEPCIAGPPEQAPVVGGGATQPPASPVPP